MPFVVNGIGTWYYGKRHIHVREGVCQLCGKPAALSSYDTTLFFVVIFLPLIPLARKRILEECPYCRKHRVLPLSKWEDAKEQDVADVLGRLDRNPQDRDAAERGIVLVYAYQDEPLLNDLVERTVGLHQRDATFQAQLGDAFGYFTRWAEAEKCYRASLEAADSDNVREALAWTVLKQGRPDEALPYLSHVLTQRKQQSAYLIFHLISAYQSEGWHDEALDLIDQRDEAFPEQAELKECKKQRKTSLRYQGTQKRIRGVSLTEKGGMGYRKGWSANMPYWIAGFIFAGLVSAYLISAVWIGQSRKVFLVNGTRNPYTVTVAGVSHPLAAKSAKPIYVTEGDVEVKFTEVKLGISPIQVHVETTFWARPFFRHSFVINPDQTAVIVQEETVYAARPNLAPPPPPPQLHFGQAFYHIAGMDYEFEEFPATLQVEGNSTIRKNRVALGPSLSDDSRVELILQFVPAGEQVQVCERLLRFEPDNAMLLHIVSDRIDPKAMRKILETRLSDRPIRVEWHRAYQSLMEKLEPQIDLVPAYQKLVAETKGNADAVYLLGRVEPDLDKSVKMYQQAAEGNPPSGHAVAGLGYRALTEGRFADAVKLMDRGMQLMTSDKAIYALYFNEALLAAGEYDPLLARLQAEQPASDQKMAALVSISRVRAIRGQKAEARDAIAQAMMQSLPQEQPAIRQSLESALCCWEGDLDGYLKAAKGLPATFETDFLRGDLRTAAGLIATGPKHDAKIFHALIYLEAKRAGDGKLADEHWEALLQVLKSGHRDERRFADGLIQPILSDEFPWRHLTIDPRSKRVLLAVLAERYPSQAEPILELARKLDYFHDAVSLCLRKVMPAAKGK